MQKDEFSKYGTKILVRGEKALKAAWGNTVAQTVLNPFGLIYGKVAETRNKLVPAYKARIPVICVGNLTMGGTGKTPVAIWIAKYLKTKGFKPCFLTRGYKGTIAAGYVTMDCCGHEKMAERIGDEAMLLLQVAPVVVEPNRAVGAREAIKNGADILVMDDGFQNPTLYKDKSLLIFDGSIGIGNGQVFPAGPLREDFELGLTRASAVVIMGEDRTGLSYEIKKRQSNMLIFHAKLSPNPNSVKALNGKKVLAFAGIGNPDKFFASLADVGVEVVQREIFPDHHKYTDADLNSLIHKATASNLQLITTQKDKVKISKGFANKILTLPVTVSFNDPSSFKAFLDV